MPKMSKVKTNVTGIRTNETFYAKFKNGGSDDLTVKGDVTPVEFTLEDLPAIDSFLLQRVTFLIGANALVELGQFGDLAALANGVLFSANGETVGQTAEVSIHTNGDAILVSSNVELETIAFAAVEATVIYGTWDFTETYDENAPIILGKDLKIIVRDDLSAMDYFKVSCHGVILEPSVVG